jgi:GT2 family glycosyltransferase
VGLVHTDYLVIDAVGNVKGIGQRSQILYSKNRLLIDFMTFHFRLMRTDAYLAAGGIDPLMELAEDYDLCLRLSEITQIRHLNKALYYYRIHDSNLTGRQIDLIQWSAVASRRAIERRGLAEQYELDVHIIGRFDLRRKNQSDFRF